MSGHSDIGSRGGFIGKRLAAGFLADNYRLGVWLAVIAAFGFSFKAILIKIAYALPLQVPIDAVTLLTLRMLIALPLFFLLYRSSGMGAAKMNSRDVAVIIVLGVVGYYGASLFDFLGLVYISAGLERVILFTYPLLTLFFDAVFSGRKIRGYEWLAVLICYVGIGLAFVHDMDASGTQQSVWLGGGFIFLSAICYAF